MRVYVDTRGWNQFNLDMKQFPDKIRRISRQVNMDAIRRMKISAGMRVPRRSGELARSIRIQPGRTPDEIILSSSSPYSVFQEEGYAPHYIPRDYLNVASTGLGVSPADLLDPSRKFKGRRGIFHPTGFAYVSKHTPFMKPAAEAIMPKIPAIHEAYMRREFKSKRYGG